MTTENNNEYESSEAEEECVEETTLTLENDIPTLQEGIEELLNGAEEDDE